MEQDNISKEDRNFSLKEWKEFIFKHDAWMAEHCEEYEKWLKEKKDE